MKKFFCLLRGLGLVSLFVTEITVNSAHADKQKSPLRGVFSFTQVVPATTGFGTPTPIPTALAGTFIMDEKNSFTGHAVLDTPLPLPEPTFEFDFQGSCTFRQGDVKNGMDCTLDVPSFGLTGVGRFCVAMAKRGECFDEFRCVDTNEPGTVLLIELKRQRLGTCQ